MAFEDTAFAALAWDKTHRGEKLNLTGYKSAFIDNFNTLSVGDSGDKTKTWKAPGRRDNVCSLAQQRAFTYQPSPFRHHIDHLHIKCEQVNGVWQSGHMQTVTTALDGFAQAMGYFEMRARFPRSVGAWPAFWLISKDPTLPRVEIDVIEAYGGDWDGHHAVIHLAGTYHRSLYTGFDTKSWCPAASKDMFNAQYHRYGVMLNDQYVIAYYDGMECGRFPMTQYFRTPLYMLVTLALNKQQAAQVTPEAKELLVDYVKTWVKI